jgi:hypothetical protein
MAVECSLYRVLYTQTSTPNHSLIIIQFSTMVNWESSGEKEAVTCKIFKNPLKVGNHELCVYVQTILWKWKGDKYTGSPGLPRCCSPETWYSPDGYELAGVSEGLLIYFND